MVRCKDIHCIYNKNRECKNPKTLKLHNEKDVAIYNKCWNQENEKINQKKLK